jgi:glutamate/tyrosine decarboxylase-like PLP-dependent enzyme
LTVVTSSQANINTAAIDPLADVCSLAHDARAWVHVDGGFGLWVAASPTLRPLLTGVELADSWATDAHKWLHVPDDSGIVFCAHPDAHRAAMGLRASYLPQGSAGERDAMDYNPELSRRARGFPIYAAIRALGRTGVAELVERCCALARRFATTLAAEDGVEVLNDVVLKPGAHPIPRCRRRSRWAHQPNGPAYPAGGHLLDERHHMAGPSRHAHISDQLVHR